MLKHIITNTSLGTRCEISLMWMLQHLTSYKSMLFQEWFGAVLTLNVRGPFHLGLTRSISLRRQDISSHDTDYVEYVGPGLTRGRILRTYVMSMWRNDIKCKYMLIFPLQNLARKEVIINFLSFCREEFFSICCTDVWRRLFIMGWGYHIIILKKISGLQVKGHCNTFE